MNILLYSPDNGVTRNFMPHLWMFLLKSLTPPEHKVFLIDGNAQPMTEKAIAQFVRLNDIRLVGISAMTRMAARAYRMAMPSEPPAQRSFLAARMSLKFRMNLLAVPKSRGMPMPLHSAKPTIHGRESWRTPLPEP